MVYDHTDSAFNKDDYQDRNKGYAIHVDDDNGYGLYTDDGYGNGDYICNSIDIYWIRRIAHALDNSHLEFDYNGYPKF